MPIPPLPKLISERLQLRIPLEKDVKELFFMRSDPQVNQFIQQRPKPKDHAEAAAFIADRTQDIANQKLYYWTITLKWQDQLIGSISLWNFSKDYSTAELGYDLHPDWQGKGIMQEAVNEVLKFGFTVVPFQTIEAFTHRNNEASKRLLLRNNFQLQANRKDEQVPANEIYSLSRKSWSSKAQ